MTASTDFVPFATGSGANVTAQSTYVAATTTSTGFGPGIASSASANKALRQATFIAAGVATMVADTLSINIPDDGNLPNFVGYLISAIEALGVTTSYVNSAIATALSTAETYAAAQAATAQSNAETYAAAQAATAQSNAETYAAAQAAGAQSAAISASETFASALISTFSNSYGHGFKLPNGYSQQWGVVSVAASGGTTSVTFPQAFTNACDSVVVTMQSIGTTAGGGWCAYGYSTTGCTIQNNTNATANFAYVASGH